MNCKKCNNEMINIQNVAYTCIQCGETHPICDKSILDKTKSFIKSSLSYTMSGFKNVTDNQKKERLDLCYSCEKINTRDNTCSECGCYVDIKTGWATESCPLGKWDALPVLQQEKKPCGGCNKQNKKSE